MRSNKLTATVVAVGLLGGACAVEGGSSAQNPNAVEATSQTDISPIEKFDPGVERMLGKLAAEREELEAQLDAGRVKRDAMLGTCAIVKAVGRTDVTIIPNPWLLTASEPGTNRELSQVFGISTIDGTLVGGAVFLTSIGGSGNFTVRTLESDTEEIDMGVPGEQDTRIVTATKMPGTQNTFKDLASGRIVGTVAGYSQLEEGKSLSAIADSESTQFVCGLGDIEEPSSTLA